MSFQYIYRFFLWAAILLSLSGCAAVNIAPSYQLSPQSGRGVLLVSATYFSSDDSYNAVTYALRNVESNLVTQLIARRYSPDPKLSPGSWTADIGSVPLRPDGQLYAIELPAGEYHVNGWSTVKPGYTVLSTKPIEGRFKVIAGQAVYIGNLHTHFRANNRYVTLRVDERQRDIPLAAQRFPSLQTASIRYDTGSTNVTSPQGMDALKDLLRSGNNSPTNNMNDLKGLLPAK